jgi:enoyl-CoA hydratase/carnithine racemase
VAAIEGHAIAGGTALVAACDFRISNGKGNFGMNEVRNGMSVPLNMLEIVRHAVLGVIDEIVAGDQLLERAVAKVTYSKQSIKAYPSIKRMMQRPAAEVMAQNKSATRLMLERDYGVGKAKL